MLLSINRKRRFCEVALILTHANRSQSLLNLRPAGCKFKRVIGIQKKISMRVQQEIEEDKLRPILAKIAKPIWLQVDAKRGG